MTDNATIPNHHASYPGFAGASGLVAALSMVRRREDNARLAAGLVDLRGDDAVLDVGCGPGAAVRLASRRAASVIGVDPAPVMLRVARLLTRSRGVRFVEGSAESLPVGDDSVTVAWAIATVHHWHDVDAGIVEVHRALRPGGRFVAIERLRTPDAEGLASHGWTEAQAAEFARRCAERGFVAVRTGSHPTRRSTVLAVVATRS